MLCHNHTNILSQWLTPAASALTPAKRTAQIHFVFVTRRVNNRPGLTYAWALSGENQDFLLPHKQTIQGAVCSTYERFRLDNRPKGSCLF